MDAKEKILKDILKDGGMCAYYDGSVYDGEAGSLHEAMDIYAKRIAIAFLLDCTGDMFIHNAEKLYDSFVADPDQQYQRPNSPDDIPESVGGGFK